MSQIPDDIARAALEIATQARIQPWTRRADIQGVRDAIAFAFAAGVASATVGAKTQWGIRRAGFKTVRITSDTNARSLLRNFVVPGEMVMREVGPWEVVATNAEQMAKRDGGDN